MRGAGEFCLLMAVQLVCLASLAQAGNLQRESRGYWDDDPWGLDKRHCCGRPCRSETCKCDDCVCKYCKHREPVFGWLGWTWKQENLYNEDDDWDR